MNVCLITIIASLSTGTCVSASGVKDILIEDFERADFGNWTVEGDAFGTGPSNGSYDWQWPAVGYKGKRIANSFAHGDDHIGQLTSPVFTIQRDYINFLVGGGNHPGQTCVELLVDDRAVRSATGHNGDTYLPLYWYTWDVSEYRGQKARIRVADRWKEGFGHILADHFVQSDISEASNHQYIRPVYHFLPITGGSFGDPHPFYDNKTGFWHMFYQSNIGDWQHARSQDLINYEHLPRALTPMKERGENSLFSGSVCLDKNGKPVIIYTSVGWGKEPKEYSEVWGASGSDNLIQWEKFPENPLFTAKDNKPFVWDFRDPYVFHADKEVFMVLGGHLMEAPERGSIEIYRALDDRLTQWKPDGILLDDDQNSGNIECPFMFEQNGKWCLGFSSFRGSEYITGSLDPETAEFTPQYRGWLESNRRFMYAPSVTSTDPKRTILWGMVIGNRSSFWQKIEGDSGCATLPRELTITDTGRVLQKPAAELKFLRTSSGVGVSSVTLKNQSSKIIGVEGDQIEVLVEFGDTKADRYGLKVLCSPEEQRGFDISCYKDKLDINNGDIIADYHLLDIKAVKKLHVLVDKSIVEVYVNDGQACFTTTARYNPDKDKDIRLFAESGEVEVSMARVYELSK